MLVLKLSIMCLKKFIFSQLVLILKSVDSTQIFLLFGFNEIINLHLIFLIVLK